MLLFSLVSMLLTYVVLRLQHLLPLNPQDLPAVADRQAFETAASFTTNTNWQSYGGRDDDVVLLPDDPARVPQLRLGGRRASPLADGARRGASPAAPAGRLGNFWVDLVRGTLYVFLPLSLRARPALRAAGRRSRTSRPTSTSRRWRAPSRSSRWARWRARKPSSSSAPTAAGSSTPTPRTRSRIPRRGPTSVDARRSS